MGYPCGKIIDGSNEYDLIPYSHVVSVTNDGTKTYKQLLNELYLAFEADGGDPANIHYAMLKVGAGRYTLSGVAGSKGSSGSLSFTHDIVNVDSLSCDLIKPAYNPNSCSYISTRVNASGFTGTSYIDNSAPASQSYTLYYS